MVMPGSKSNPEKTAPGRLPREVEAIRVRGARVHNLRRLDVDIPLHQLTVVTGVSGSGKSSLAFETLYAEGQRRYVESLSAYARQFLERLEKPEADSIEGIAPAIAIRQKNPGRNPRSTVATATEIHDYLRLLYARVGRVICPDCRVPAVCESVDEAIARLLAEAEGRRAYLLFPLTAGAAAENAASGPPARKARRRARPSPSAPAARLPNEAQKQRLAELRARGFHRLRQGERTVEFSTPESLLELDFSQPVGVVTDRLQIAAAEHARLAEAVETAYREAGELQIEVLAEEDAPARRLRFSQRLECPRCARPFELPPPSGFSFNHSNGACPVCQGFGNAMILDLDKVIPNPDLSLNAGAIDPWSKPRFRAWGRALKEAARRAGVPLDVPWRDLSQREKKLVLDGEGEFAGVRGFFQRLERKKYKMLVRIFIARYRGYEKCPACQGLRLRPESLWVELPAAPDSNEPANPWQGWNLGQLTMMTVRQAGEYFRALQLPPAATVLAGGVLPELRNRLDYLEQAGLHYLTLDRVASTLSGGEGQRIQLATCLGAQLAGALYVLDEPSIGLHARDTGRLIRILEQLRGQGNTLVVVEHDAAIMRAADWLLDLGPEAGELGGHLMAAGPWREVALIPESRTGQYLRRWLPGAASKDPHPASALPRRPPRPGVRLLGASRNNLRGLDVDFPAHVLTAVTGVSGSGKSTLVHQVLYRNLEARLRSPRAEPIACRELRHAERVRELVLVDQSPIGRTPRSNPVTYVGAYDAIRKLFAQTPEAIRQGFTPRHFSFNVAGGRCEVCAGAGTVTIEMQFLADVELTCEACRGTRFQAPVLEVRWRGKNIAEALQLTLHESLAFFAGQEKILAPLRLLGECGLGYLRLGQSATTLSGGEAQRLKLAARLADAGTLAGAWFLLDEPTTGLHADDIAKLLHIFQRLLAGDATVLVIEHNLDLIAAADWILDLGPEGGSEGGQLTGAGTPEQIARLSTPTGLALAAHGLGISSTTQPAS